jgi:hypothetical protein
MVEGSTAWAARHSAGCRRSGAGRGCRHAAGGQGGLRRGPRHGGGAKACAWWGQGRAGRAKERGGAENGWIVGIEGIEVGIEVGIEGIEEGPDRGRACSAALAVSRCSARRRTSASLSDASAASLRCRVQGPGSRDQGVQGSGFRPLSVRCSPAATSLRCGPGPQRRGCPPPTSQPPGGPVALERPSPRRQRCASAPPHPPTSRPCAVQCVHVQCSAGAQCGGVVQCGGAF